MLTSRYGAMAASVAAGIVFGWLALANAQDDSITIAGSVIDAQTGTVIQDASVVLRSNGSVDSGERARVSANGLFEARGRSTSKMLVAEAPGYATYRLGLNERPSSVRVEMERASKITGTVASATGEPLAAVVSTTTQNTRNVVSKSTRAMNGQFELTGLLSGRTTLVVRAQEKAPAVAHVVISPGTSTPAAFRLEDEAVIGGRVVSVQGEPVGSVKIEVSYALPREDSNLLASLIGGYPTTNAEGYFQLRNVVPGTTATLRATQGTRSASTQIIPQPGERTYSVVLTLVER